MTRAAAILGVALAMAATAAGGTETDPVTVAAAVEALAPQPGLASLMRQADGWLLAGRTAPPELPRLLEPLAPSDRFTAVAYLRRLGVLEGGTLDVEALLKPAGGTP